MSTAQMMMFTDEDEAKSVSVTIDGITEELMPLVGECEEWTAEVSKLKLPYLPISNEDMDKLYNGGCDYYLLRGSVVVTFAGSANSYSLTPLNKEAADSVLAASGKAVTVTGEEALEQLKLEQIRRKVVQLDASLVRAKEIAIQYCEQIEELVASEIKLLHGAEDDRYLMPSHEMEKSYKYDYQNKLHTMAAKIIRRMVSLALSHYDPHGDLRLEIAVEDVQEASGLNGRDWDVEAFSALKGWEYIVENHSGDKAADKARKAAANDIIKYLNLRASEEIVTKKGRMVLGFQVWQESYSSKLTYTCQCRLSSLTASLASVAVWAGNKRLARDLQGYTHTGGVESRHKEGFGAEVELITYKTRFEFNLQQEFAQKLQVFLSSYGDMPE